VGKASDLHQALISEPLTAAELEQRKAEAESGGDVLALQDGRLVKLDSATVQPREVGRAPQQTWD
jgi:hypothetical protein